MTCCEHVRHRRAVALAAMRAAARAMALDCVMLRICDLQAPRRLSQPPCWHGVLVKFTPSFVRASPLADAVVCVGLQCQCERTTVHARPVYEPLTPTRRVWLHCNG